MLSTFFRIITGRVHTDPDYELWVLGQNIMDEPIKSSFWKFKKFMIEQRASSKEVKEYIRGGF